MLPVAMFVLLYISGLVYNSDNGGLLYSNTYEFRLSALEIENIFSSDSLNTEHALKRPVKPTFKKLALEWLGGAGGGLVVGGAMYYLTEPMTENAQSDGPYAVCSTLSLVSAFFGVAGGTTLVGNAITEPNGSFGKACLGELAFIPVSAIFTGIGAMLMSALAGADFTENGGDATLAVVGCIFGTSIIFPPPYGAVMGYNSQKMCCCSTGTSGELHDHLKLLNLSFKIHLIEIHF